MDIFGSKKCKIKCILSPDILYSTKETQNIMYLSLTPCVDSDNPRVGDLRLLASSQAGQSHT